MASSSTNCSMLRTNASLIGTTAVVDAKRWLLCTRRYPTTAPTVCKCGTYTLTDRSLQAQAQHGHAVHPPPIVLRSFRTPVVHGSCDPPSFELLCSGHRPCRLDRSPPYHWRLRSTPRLPHTPRRSEAEPR